MRDLRPCLAFDAVIDLSHIGHRVSLPSSGSSRHVFPREEPFSNDPIP
jgi:hypothetical protein